MAANNATDLLMDGLSITNTSTAVATAAEAVLSNATVLETLSTIPSIIWESADILILELRIIFSALACIYIGSFGALRRPPSAAPPKKKNGKKGDKGAKEEKEDQFVQGLIMSDAVMFPILAGTVLIGLYYIIKWLGDADILNKILKYYFSFMSLGSLGKLFADGLHLVARCVFPTVWTDFLSGTMYHIDDKGKGQWFTKKDASKKKDKNSGAGTDADTAVPKTWDENMRSPLPGPFFSSIKSKSVNRFLWGLRHLFRGGNFKVDLFIRGIVNNKFDVTFNQVLGIVLSIVTSTLYHATSTDKSPSNFISNLLGYAFSYTTILLLSPTTFATGSAVLFGLFFYDIAMVFYTPYMITVATKVDAPVKLVFAGPKRSSMLGLGDIVIPGMFVALCLRFDHYMHYLKQQKLVPVELKKDEIATDDAQLNQTKTTTTSTEIQRMVVKPEYVNPQGQWGDYLWTWTPFSKSLSSRKDIPAALKASLFSKPYFYAALVGYVVALEVTLIIMLVFKHGQPALLYLVPGVVGSVWATACVRGEVGDMWKYTEDGSLDGVDVVVVVDGEGKVVRQVEGEKTDGTEGKPALSQEKKETPEKEKKHAVDATEDTTATDTTKSEDTAAVPGANDSNDDTNEDEEHEGTYHPFFRLAVETSL
ncbi:signal peptide peptidase-domain-containing protein [Xylariaceae sp. FL0255]|nr:signal peptide peptidase-domain-containing protein [Xylariaceae sp. FL0255]